MPAGNVGAGEQEVEDDRLPEIRARHTARRMLSGFFRFPTLLELELTHVSEFTVPISKSWYLYSASHKDRPE